jgi:hypothetical protein
VIVEKKTLNIGRECMPNHAQRYTQTYHPKRQNPRKTTRAVYSREDVTCHDRRHIPLPNDSIAFCWWRSRGRCKFAVATTIVRCLRWLKLHAVLLSILRLCVSIIALVCSVVSIVWLCGVLRRWGVGGLLVIVVRLCVVLAWSGSPAGAVEGLAAGFTTAACCQATVQSVREVLQGPLAVFDLPAENEEEEEAADDYGEDNPSHPVVPWAVSVAYVIVVAVITTPSHVGLDL